MMYLVHVPPPPVSFAEVAAKEIPPEEKPLSERAQAIIKEQETQPKEEPLSVNDENFPTLGQSRLMAEQNAKDEEKEVYTEISKLNQAGDIVEEEEEDIVVVDNKGKVKREREKGLHNKYLWETQTQRNRLPTLLAPTWMMHHHLLNHT